MLAASELGAGGEPRRSSERWTTGSAAQDTAGLSRDRRMRNSLWAKPHGFCRDPPFLGTPGSGLGHFCFGNEEGPAPPSTLMVTPWDGTPNWCLLWWFHLVKTNFFLLSSLSHLCGLQVTRATCPHCIREQRTKVDLLRNCKCTGQPELLHQHIPFCSVPARSFSRDCGVSHLPNAELQSCCFSKCFGQQDHGGKDMGFAVPFGCPWR